MTPFLSAAVRALRLNRQFPPRDMAAGFLACFDQPDWHPQAGLPSGTDWLDIDAQRAGAQAALHRWSSVDPLALSPAERSALDHRMQRLNRLSELPALPRRRFQVRLRHHHGKLASYEVVVDRFDPASCTLARYTIVLEDRPGIRMVSGELDLHAHEHFESALSRLDDQDAALAFAVLSEHVTHVESVTRGVIGPAVVRLPSGRVGPDDLDDLPLSAPVLSACLERASVDLRGGVVDDPLVDDVVLPHHNTGFGVARRRKWAACSNDVIELRNWLKGIQSRNLVYEVRHGI